MFGPVIDPILWYMLLTICGVAFVGTFGLAIAFPCYLVYEAYQWWQARYHARHS